VVLLLLLLLEYDVCCFEQSNEAIVGSGSGGVFCTYVALSTRTT
jgi:hypothetical protein